MSKIIKIVIGLAIVGAALYFGSDYLGNKTSTSSVTITAGAEDSADADVLSTLNALNSVSFDVDFFGNKIFQSLSDFSVVLMPREAGRDNPFAPAGSGGFTQSSQAVSNSLATTSPANTPKSGR